MKYANNTTHKEKYYGLSGETKPLGLPAGSEFEEMDTGKLFISDGTNWILKNSNNTSGVLEFEIFTEITRPANTTAYATNQIVNGSGATSLPALDLSVLGNVANRKIQINSIAILSSNGSAGTKLTPIIHLFNSNTITGQALTDGTAFNPSYSEMKNKRAATFENLTTVINHGSGAYISMQTELIRNAILDSNGKLYAAIITSGSYTPASGENLTLIIKGYLL